MQFSYGAKQETQGDFARISHQLSVLPKFWGIIYRSVKNMIWMDNSANEADEIEHRV